MNRIARTLLIGVLAAALFLVGGIGLFSRWGGGAGSATLPVPDTGALLRPGGKGDLDRSIAFLQERIRDVPGDAGAMAALGLAYVQQARITADPRYYPQAEQLLRRSLRVSPDGNEEALVGLAALAAARHEFADALRFGERARSLDPYDANVHGVVGDALVELGRYDQAFDSFQTMVDTRPDVASYARVSYALELRGHTRAAIDAMRSALGFASAAEDRAWVSHQLGELYLREGRLSAASGLLRRSTQLDRDLIAPYAGLAKVAWARGHLDRAITLLERVVRRYPAPDNVVALGDLYRVAGDPDSARRQYELARIEAELFRANGVNGDLELALFEANHGDPRKALAAAQAEWERRQSIHVADALGWALHVNGRDDEAARFAGRATALGTRSGLFLYHAGAIAAARGDDSAARRLLTEALDVDPFFSILGAQEARRLLARLGA